MIKFKFNAWQLKFCFVCSWIIPSMIIITTLIFEALNFHNFFKVDNLVNVEWNRSSIKSFLFNYKFVEKIIFW